MIYGNTTWKMKPGNLFLVPKLVTNNLPQVRIFFTIRNMELICYEKKCQEGEQEEWPVEIIISILLEVKLYQTLPTQQQASYGNIILTQIWTLLANSSAFR